MEAYLRRTKSRYLEYAGYGPEHTSFSLKEWTWFIIIQVAQMLLYAAGYILLVLIIAVIWTMVVLSIPH
jgi:hypothetical protein